MVTEDQREVIEYLSARSDERIETHAALVFLHRDRAWKLKRAVRFDYLDFSTVDRRREMCEAEVRLNRRTAPKLYRGAVPVTRAADGSIGLGGTGQVLDWVVEMNRFANHDLLDRRAAAGNLDVDTMSALAEEIATFHRHAAVRTDHGGSDAMVWVVDGNAAGFAEFGAGLWDPADSLRLTRLAQAAIAANRSSLDVRRESGFVRQCHGDLHLRNIVMLDDHPTLFDAVEFNDELACIDVWYDLAFLIMDLLKRDLPRHASAVFNRYLSLTADIDALRLLPLFLSCRAAIRAKTSATAATLQSDVARRPQLERLAHEYVGMAERLLQPPGAVLMVVAGLSGSGKSTVAQHLAPGVGAAPGAVVLRSDEMRKQLAGVSLETRLGADAYTAEMSSRVYGALASRAARVLATGHAVIVDAVYARPEDRDAIEHVAAKAGVPFVGCWLDAPEAVLLERVGARHHDVSDADASVVHMQTSTPVGTVRWLRIDASGALDDVVKQVPVPVRGNPLVVGAPLPRLNV